MSLFCLTPRAPLVFRLGRPFGGSEAATTLPFPPPHTLAGALRAAIAEQWRSERGLAPDAPLWDEVNELAVEGPLLVRRRMDGGALGILLPAPADVVALRPADGGGSFIAPLLPRTLPDTTGMNLADGLMPLEPALRRLNLPPGAFEKTRAEQGPACRSLDWTLRWLSADHGDATVDRNDRLNELDGLDALPVARRAHVRIAAATGAADRGLFHQTEGLDFGPRALGDQPAESFGLLLRTRREISIPRGLRRVGGRGRLALLEPLAEALWPSRCPTRLRRALARSPGVRLMLVTPACFASGWRPDWLSWKDGHWQGEVPGLAGLHLRLRAVALDQWMPATPWDGNPDRQHFDALRRVTPAGTVFWFDVLAGHAHLPELWFHNIAGAGDATAAVPKATRHPWTDGYGLAVPGVWHPDPERDTGDASE